ncbi:undecaprenol kinase, putative [Pseudooceanicola batsensis HTCC2597]|uniref:Undecaprenyl-diphosphatase n=1 Tax=Pseudooceanicola batsensis (strain ATCC BAA-863 / DSM 15984 / KCTC 12145 / HTCC2597) TaxID=252305 RepID=A3TWF4_PSEBH|nr:undecaprenyl-diphosphate phosphatase [Pseudooceanicola batsensis]EAQ03950.1 undecaprenol kinase, putative [Pseudooceanicola batsensis HTCC2597]
MPLFQLILLAVIQGITEFLPISSSGHLILLPQLTSLADQGQTIDVAVHVGTLGAVILYFRRDVAGAAAGLPRLVVGRMDTAGARLAFLLIVATVPAILAGLAIKVTGLDDLMRSALVIGVTMLVFGIVLWRADQRGAEIKVDRDWTLREAWVLGLWQAVALIPGTSRSGIVITGARFMGYARHDAAKLSMLMSIPVIVASGVLLGADVLLSDDTVVARDAMIAAGFAFMSALLALALMMRLLRTVSFTPYVVYRVVLGLGLIWWSLA